MTVGAGFVADAGGDDSEADEVQDMPDVPAPTMSAPMTPAERADLEFYAKEHGLDVDVVVDRFGTSRPFSVLLGTLAQTYPDDYAGGALMPDGSHWVGWKALMPDAARSTIVDFESSVAASGGRSPGAVTVYEQLGFTERSLHAEVEKVHLAVHDDPRTLHVGTSADPLTGEIVTIAQVDEAVLAGGADTLMESLTRERPELAGTTLLLTTDTISEDDGTQYGGEYMSGCTSGFTVHNGHGINGIATAGHCGDSQTMDGDSLTLAFEHQGTHGDMQWHHRSASSFPDDYYGGSTTALEVDLRDVGGLGWPAIGTAVCRNGKTNFKHCDSIRKTGLCKDSRCNLVGVHNRTAGSGDSGGPWFYGNAAYGVHTGGKNYDGASRDVFTRTDRLDNGMSVWVRD